MALLETLVVGVGAGIAKGVLKLWLGDFELAEQVSLSVLDIVKKKTEGPIRSELCEAPV